MDFRSLPGLLVCLVVLPGCAQIAQLRPPSPGEKILTFPDPVAKEYKCQKRKLPFFLVEESTLTPDRVKPGDLVRYRYVYVMCSKMADVVKGMVHTRIHYRGTAVFTDTVALELQPGRWRVESAVEIPLAAGPGIYALEAEFRSKQGGFKAQSAFLVE